MNNTDYNDDENDKISNEFNYFQGILWQLLLSLECIWSQAQVMAQVDF